MSFGKPGKAKAIDQASPEFGILREADHGNFLNGFVGVEFEYLPTGAGRDITTGAAVEIGRFRFALAARSERARFQRSKEAAA